MTSRPGPRLMTIAADSRPAIDAAVEQLEAGHPIALATDTVYGLAVRADDREGVAAIFELKGRPPDRHIAVLVAGADQAARLVDLTGPGSALVAEFWPGPLTIVARRLEGSRAAVGDEQTLGVRCPANDVVRAIADRAGPLAATSANRHGDPTPPDARSVAELFPTLGLVLDGGELSAEASTVVDVAEDRLSILREGPIGAAALHAALGLDPR